MKYFLVLFFTDHQVEYIVSLNHCFLCEDKNFMLSKLTAKSAECTIDILKLCRLFLPIVCFFHELKQWHGRESYRELGGSLS